MVIPAPQLGWRRLTGNVLQPVGWSGRFDLIRKMLLINANILVSI